MKRCFILFYFCLLVASCSDSDKSAPPASENEIDAARNFIRASLDGKFDKARTFMLRDEANDQSLDQMEILIQQNRTTEEKVAYQNADIKIFESRRVNDSVYVVTYANTYKNKKDSLKLVRTNGDWLVDFKYSVFRETPANAQ